MSLYSVWEKIIAQFIVKRSVFYNLSFLSIYFSCFFLHKRLPNKILGESKSILIWLCRKKLRKRVSAVTKCQFLDLWEEFVKY